MISLSIVCASENFSVRPYDRATPRVPSRRFRARIAYHTRLLRYHRQIANDSDLSRILPRTRLFRTNKTQTGDRANPRVKSVRQSGPIVNHRHYFPDGARGERKTMPSLSLSQIPSRQHGDDFDIPGESSETVSLRRSRSEENAHARARGRRGVEIKARKRVHCKSIRAEWTPVFRIMRHDGAVHARGLLGASIVAPLRPLGATRIDGTGALPDRKGAPRLFGKRGDRSLSPRREATTRTSILASAFVRAA